jgi:hypothetical protein
MPEITGKSGSKNGKVVMNETKKRITINHLQVF